MKLKITYFIFFIVFFSCKKSEPEQKPPSNSTLKESFQDAFLIGDALNEDMSSGRDTVSQNIVIKQFNAITPENVMKAEVINPKPGEYNFKPAVFSSLKPPVKRLL